MAANDPYPYLQRGRSPGLPNWIRISVKDTGVGISHEDLRNIFDPFFSTKETGTGLGLPISLGIIEAHGGTIQITSQVGAGTRVVVKLPLRADKKDEIDESEERKILIVDDRINTLKVLMAILEDEGYSIITANSGTKALKIYRETPDIDLVLSDLKMSEIDGVELYRKMDGFRKAPPDPRRPAARPFRHAQLPRGPGSPHDHR